MNVKSAASRILVGGQAGLAIPLVVGVTGHRDLLEEEVPHIRQRVRDFLLELQARCPERGVTLMSGLADGADQLAAEEALALGMSLLAVLPMARDVYAADFPAGESRARFERLCDSAREIFELPLAEGNTAEGIADHGPQRDRQYAQLGVFLCAHSHILLALWDGKYSDQLGGTGQVVRFHHHDIMPGYASDSASSSLMLTDDESDLVYHVVCSRDQPHGEPAASLVAGDWWWFSLDKDAPRSKTLPERYLRVFRFTTEFSLDAVRHADAIRDGSWPLMDSADAKELPSGLRDIDQVFCAADWLAIHFQKRLLGTLRLKHVIALLMGLLYIAYSDMHPHPLYLYGFLSLFVAATGLHVMASRGAWHRKYLDYRTLAEGLRVQFYWAAAGVRRGTMSKFTHDNFLQTQDAELGWIRNVMRVAGTECDASDYRRPEGLEFTLREWVGDDDSGQLGYYRRKSDERAKRFLSTERMAKAGFWIGFAAIALFILATPEVGDRLRDPLVVLMGAMLLLVGIRQSYSFSMGDAELIRQYRFMHRIFDNARQRIDAAHTLSEKRRVLRMLGDAALEENAQWILMHRDRAVDQGEIFRMSG